MAYNENQAVLLKHLVSATTMIKAKIDSTVENLPKEQFLDQAKTQFIGSFAFNAETYPGATDPNLNGKPVFVLAVKGIDNKTKAETLKYSFIDMSALVDTYEVKDGDSKKVLTISGYEVEFKFDGTTLEATANGLKVKVSGKTGNALSTDEDGGLYVDISGKADKVENATAGHIATLDAEGNITDSGVAVSETSIGKADKVSGATNGNLAALDANGNLTDSGVAASSKADKVSNATNGNIAGLDANGNVTDSGISADAVNGKADKLASSTNGHIAGVDGNGQYTDGGIAIDNIVTSDQIATDAEVEEALNGVFGAAS